MGVDLHTADLLDQIVHYGGSPASSFVFLVDATSGLSVYHPGGLRDLLTSPTSRSQNRLSSATGSASTDGNFHSTSTFQDPLLHIDVRYLERTPGFESLVLSRIMSGEINGTVDWLVEIVSASNIIISKGLTGTNSYLYYALRTPNYSPGSKPQEYGLKILVSSYPPTKEPQVATTMFSTWSK